MEAAAALQEGQGEAPGLQRMRTRAHDASSTLGEMDVACIGSKVASSPCRSSGILPHTRLSAISG